jgi:16S rRNA G966 N2-methylase RsmD
LKAHGEVVHSDAFAYLKRPVDWCFDYIFIAPPQYKTLWQKVLLAIDANTAWLSPDAWVIVQIDPVEYDKLALAHLEEFDQRRYGSTLLVFYEIKAS